MTYPNVRMTLVVTDEVVKECIAEMGGIETIGGIDLDSSIIIMVFGGHDLSPQYFQVYRGEASFAVNFELLQRKANVVRSSGRSAIEVKKTAKKLGVSVLDWIPTGTTFLGASPIKDTNGRLIGIVSVSGQNQDVDQIISDALAKNIEDFVHDEIKNAE